MSRNSRFFSHEPLANDDSLQLRPEKVRGPFSFLNPTGAHFQHVVAADDAAAQTPHPDTKHVEYKWTSRNNRKGRHALVVDSSKAPPQMQTPQATSEMGQVLKGIVRMFTVFPVWDVSYLVATIFTLGSVLWVFNAFFVFLPLLQPSTLFPNEELYGGGITAFIGATIFEIGSVLLMMEAVNENRTGCFGWAIERVVEKERGRLEDGARLHIRPGKSGCTHHHVNKSNFVGKGNSNTSSDYSPSLKAEGLEEPKSWVWFPSWQELKTHYFRELGFIACSSQMFGATVFWISGFTALPGVLNKLSPALVNGVYWTPQVIGGSGFVISGTLFMIETQKKWYLPAPKVLGWHIGLWNLIGGIGFTLSPAFGYNTSSWAVFEASNSTFWGSWAFLIGSTIQWYESLDKYPVEEGQT